MDILLIYEDSKTSNNPNLSLKGDLATVNIETVTSLEEAINLLRNNSYDLVVSEYHGVGADNPQLMDFLNLVGKNKLELFFINRNQSVEEISLKVGDSRDSRIEGVLEPRSATNRTILTDGSGGSQTEKENLWQEIREKLRKTTEKLEKVRDDAKKRNERMKKLAENITRTKRQFQQGFSREHEEHDNIKGQFLKTGKVDWDNLDPELLPSRILALKRFLEKHR